MSNFRPNSKNEIRDLHSARVITFIMLPMLLLLAWWLILPNDAFAGKIKSPGTWTGLCGLPGGIACLLEPREGAGTSQIANQIIVSHGFSAGDTNDTRIYDIDTDTWFDPAPVPPFARRSELAAVAHGHLHYAVGGRGICAFSVGGVCRDLEVYDPVMNTWTSLSPMPTARAGLAAVVVGNTLFALGGRTGTVPGSGVPLGCVEAYDIATDTWSAPCGAPGTLAPMPIPVMDTAAIAHGNEIFVIGGARGPDPVVLGIPLSDDVQIYNVAHDIWSLGTPMLTPRANLGLGKCGNVIIADGGRTDSAFLGSAANVATVEAYAIPMDAWTTPLTPMPTARSEHGSASHGDFVYAIGSGIFGVSSSSHEALSCSSLFRK